MSSVAQAILRFFRGHTAQGQRGAPAGDPHSPPRRSSGLAEFLRRIAGQEGLSILDLGPTSPANISHLTNLGHKVYNEDLLSAALDPALQVTGEGGKPTIDIDKFLKQNLLYEREQFDGVLCWDMAD